MGYNNENLLENDMRLNCVDSVNFRQMALIMTLLKL